MTGIIKTSEESGPWSSFRLVFSCDSLKIVRTLFNYRVLGTSTTDISFSLCTYILWMDVMFDFICMAPVDLPGARQ